MRRGLLSFFFFFFNDTATTEIYTLSLHDALPIYEEIGRAYGALRFCSLQNELRFERRERSRIIRCGIGVRHAATDGAQDRKSTRLNSSHSQISYAVFCLKKKKHKHSTSANIELSR